MDGAHDLDSVLAVGQVLERVVAVRVGVEGLDDLAVLVGEAGRSRARRPVTVDRLVAVVVAVDNCHDELFRDVAGNRRRPWWGLRRCRLRTRCPACCGVAGLVGVGEGTVLDDLDDGVPSGRCSKYLPSVVVGGDDLAILVEELDRHAG